MSSRYWSKVVKGEGCWLWQASVDKHGYGRFRVGNKVLRAHRVAYEMEYGAIQEGMEIDHIDCPDRACVRPSHLREATGKQNQENQTGPRVDSVSGVRGVTAAGSKGWRARVKHNGKLHSAGYFKDLAEAEAAVVALRNTLYTHNDRDR